MPALTGNLRPSGRGGCQVYDDWKVGTTRHTWRKPAAMVWMPSPEEQAAATALPAPIPRPCWSPPAPPVGYHEGKPS